MLQLSENDAANCPVSLTCNVKVVSHSQSGTSRGRRRSLDLSETPSVGILRASDDPLATRDLPFWNPSNTLLSEIFFDLPVSSEGSGSRAT